MDPEGVAIPLRVSFIGLKSVPVVALAHNNAAPLLVLFDDHFVQRVVFRKARRYEDVERVDVSRTDSDNLEVAFVNRWLTFSCKTRADADLVRALRLFESKGVSLGESARRRLTAAPAAGDMTK